MLKKIPFRVIPDEKAKEPLPDGEYVVVRFCGQTIHTRYGFAVENPFPWWAAIVRFSEGICDFPHSASDLSYLLDFHGVKEVLVVDMPESRRRELDVMLAKSNIELVAA